MKELKIIKHATYTYETSDGREFDDEIEAKEWQEKLLVIENVCMLDINFRSTKDVESVFYVHTKTKEETDAFNSMQEYVGIDASLDGVGYFRYDETSDSFMNIELQIKELQSIIDKLQSGS